MVYVAPHHDDVPLSCGGTAALAARAGLSPLIVTVFASEVVHQMVNPFAAWKHSRWGIDDPLAVSDVRRAEDAAAAHELGCTPHWLGLPDAIYRGERYSGDGALYGSIHPEEAGLPYVIAQELLEIAERSGRAALAVPLALGNHVDHQIVFEAGRLLAQQGVSVLAYEDLPYAIHTPTSMDERLGRIGTALGDQVLVDIDSTMTEKIQAVGCYASQLPVIFRFTTDWVDSLVRHARSIEDGRCVERFWAVLG